VLVDSVTIQCFDDLMVSEAMRLLEDPEVRVRLAVGQLLRSLAAKHGLSVLQTCQETVLNSIHTHFVSDRQGGLNGWLIAGGSRINLGGKLAAAGAAAPAQHRNASLNPAKVPTGMVIAQNMALQQLFTNGMLQEPPPLQFSPISDRRTPDHPTPHTLAALLLIAVPLATL
jgi:hypothetical protein